MLCANTEGVFRIITKIDELMTLCDTLKARLNEAQITKVQLADTIVTCGGIIKNRSESATKI